MPVSTFPEPSPGTPLQVIVYVEDVNDEAPVFTQQQYNRLGLRETAGIGTSVIVVRATDRDTGKAGGGGRAGGAKDTTSQSDPPIARAPVTLRSSMEPTPRLRRGSLLDIHSTQMPRPQRISQGSYPTSEGQKRVEMFAHPD